MIRAEKAKAEKANTVSPQTREPDSDDEEVPVGDGDIGRTSAQPSGRERGRVTHFSHRIEATEEPKKVPSRSQVKAKSRDDLWYSWVEEQSKLNNSNKVRALLTETA
jgi:hypothetical protein